MEKKENKVEKAVTSNKLGGINWLTKKTTYSLLAIIGCIGLILALSLVNAKFDTTKLKTIAYWVDFAILSAICIFGMVIGQQIGDDLSRNNQNGQFRKSLKKYSDAYNRVDNQKLFSFFDDWLVLYREKKIQSKIKGYLKNNGIHQMEVLNLDLSEIDMLKNPYKKVWNDGSETYFFSCTEEQIEIIRECLSGEVKVSELSQSFFVDAFDTYAKDMWESASNSGKKKTLYVSTSYIYRIIGLLAFSLLMSGLGKGEDISLKEATFDAMSRLFTLVMAITFGVYVGFQLVKIDIQYLDFKTSILNQYAEENELGIYVHQTLEQKAKLEYEKSIKANKEVVEENGNTREQEIPILE